MGDKSSASLKNKSKEQLIQIIEQQSAKQVELEERISKLESTIKFSDRLVQIERRIANQEQYSRRECVELVGLSKAVDQSDLEQRVMDVFHHAGVNVKKRDFHAIHTVGKKGVVIAKLVNRRDAIAILRAKKSLRELDSDGKKKLKCNKLYINESLCPAFRRLLGVCNSLRKKGKAQSAYTINGKIKLKINDSETIVIGHLDDLSARFGAENIKEILNEHSSSSQ